jgi:hypothetical protein
MATLQSNIPALIGTMRRGAARVVTKTAHAIEADVKTGMAEPKSGRTYRRKNGKTHQASAPGESPAIDDSNLANSVSVADVGETTKAVGASAEQAIPMELGGAHTAPRPFLGPAFERAAPQFEADLKTIFEG